MDAPALVPNNFIRIPDRTSKMALQFYAVYSTLLPSVSCVSVAQPRSIASRRSRLESCSKSAVASLRVCEFCSCSRRQLLSSSLLATLPVDASDPRALLNKVRPPRPEWYEESLALVLAEGMKAYEAEIAGYKADLFSHFIGENKKVLELGVGTGPNFKYYAWASGTNVIGVDPNKQMKSYAQRSALAAGLPATHFNFIQAVGEALPIADASVDVVIGTLVLCSVTDVDKTLEEVRRVLRPGGIYIFIEHVAAKDGTTLKLLQRFFDPLQQVLADGCHLMRESGRKIAAAEFSYVNVKNLFLSHFSLISPHVYGVAFK